MLDYDTRYVSDFLFCSCVFKKYCARQRLLRNFLTLTNYELIEIRYPKFFSFRLSIVENETITKLVYFCNVPRNTKIHITQTFIMNDEG